MTRSVFSALDEVAARVRHAGHLLLGLDFDGTLSPLVADPRAAVLPPETAAAVAALAGVDRVTVMVASGRALADVRSRVGLDGLIYAGNHGLEIAGPGFEYHHTQTFTAASGVAAVSADLRHRLRHLPGVLIEDKGLTLSVHYRQAPAARDEVRQTVEAAVGDGPFRVLRGNRVFEVRPAVAWHKGSALAWVRDRLGPPAPFVAYVGDDTTDEDAFAAFPDGVTVRVHPGAATAARYTLRDPAEVLRFLDWLHDRLTDPGEA